MLRSILYLLRIAPGYDVEDMDGIPGKDFGPNWIRGLFFYLYRLKWCRDEYIRVEYFFEYVHYLTEDDVNARNVLADGRLDRVMAYITADIALNDTDLSPPITSKEGWEWFFKNLQGGE